MKHPHIALPSSQRGLSIIELMVAMLIGAMIVFAVGSIALSNQVTFRSSQAVADVQDAARTAFELMAKDIRQAGDDGCGNGKITPLAANNDAWWAGSPTADAWPGALDIRTTMGNIPGGASMAGSNVLVVLGTGSEIHSISADVTSGSDTLTIFPPNHNYAAGQYVLVCDWNSPGVLTEIRSTSADTVTLTEALARSVQRNGVISDYNAVVWYIREDATNDNIPTLWRIEHNRNGAETPVAILPGVTQMTVLARVAGESDFVDYATIADRNSIDAIQIDYTMISLAKNTATPDPNNASANTSDRIQRQYMLVVPLHNRTKKVLAADPNAP